MWDKLVARMVERAMPPNIIDPVLRILAAEAAEYGIRQAARIASIASFVGAILLVAMAALLYSFVPNQQSSLVASNASKATTEPVTDNITLRNATENLQKKLDDMTKKRDALQSKVTTLEGQVAELSRQLQTARRSAADWQKQAEASKKPLKASKQPSRPARTRVGTKPSSTPTGSEGRTVRDPGERKKAANAPDPPVEAPPPKQPAPRTTTPPPKQPVAEAATSAPEGPPPQALRSTPAVTLDPPPAKAKRPMTPAAVPTRPPKEAASPPIAPDPLNGR